MILALATMKGHPPAPPAEQSAVIPVPLSKQRDQALLLRPTSTFKPVSELQPGLETILRNESRAMNEIQAEPAIAEARLKVIANHLSDNEAQLLAQKAIEPNRDHDERFLAVLLLGLRPLDFANELLFVLARPPSDSPFERALNFKLLTVLEKAGEQEPRVFHGMATVALSADAPLRNEIMLSLAAARFHHSYWNEKIQRLATKEETK